MPAKMLDGWHKNDPMTSKKLPVEDEVSEYLGKLWAPSAIALQATMGDFTLVAFNYLLQIWEYICKGECSNMKQTMQFTMEDATFFHCNNDKLQQLP